ncbi:tetratricopeptide repeat protein [Dictyobacter alpinus]|uniref:Tetratricopeptide repeat protein n=1 Tax=Dictyobacter alpinus TaxID=2014873 RepID=A0A402BJ10_9CHLR|nr:FxSxx-COOH system tetratricopeptide repeat protein [Dictyobacter alpinus]GCE31353.1 tetratricopeptide repeat protein [Dictyobacter alpinus]
MNSFLSGPFSDILKHLRKQKKVSQKKLALRLGMHINTIGKWERGICLPDSKGIVLELAKQLSLNEQETRQLLEASLTAVSTYWNVPYQRNPFFTGRDDILEHIHTTFSQEAAVAFPQPLALSGLGGIGKTQTALAYAYIHALEYDGVFWISSESSEQIMRSFSIIASCLSLPQTSDQDQQKIVNAVLHWFARHRNYLLIYDNVEDLDLLQSFFPLALPDGHILLTTRLQVTEPVAMSLPLNPFPDEQGMLLLLRRIKRVAMNDPLTGISLQEQTLACKISQTLGGLPLALDQAGAYLLETGSNFSDYLHFYEQKHQVLLTRRGRIPTNHPASVTTTFLLAFERLRLQHASIIHVLQVCAFLDADMIPDALFIEGADQVEVPVHASPKYEKFVFNEIMELFRLQSLLQRDNQNSTFSLHRLLQTVLRNEMDEETYKDVIQQCVDLLNETFPLDILSLEQWTWCQQLIPHVLNCLNFAQQRHYNSCSVALLLHKAAKYLQEQGQYAHAESFFLQTLQMYEQLVDSSHPRNILALNDLGWLYYNQGSYEQAEKIYRQALHICQEYLDPMHTSVALVLNNLAVLSANQGQYEQAERMYLQALKSHEYHLGSDHPETVASLNNLAILYHHQGRYEKSKQLFHRSLQSKEKQLGVDHPLTATTRSNLALVYLDQGEYEQAETLFLHALKVREEHLGPIHPLTAQNLSNLAKLYGQQGKYEQAENYALRALRICEEHLGLEHPSTANTLSILGRLYYKQGKYEVAEPIILRVLEIRKKGFGLFHPRTAFAMNNVALLYIDQRKYQEAEPFVTQALKICEDQLGMKHPWTAIMLSTLATLYTHQMDYAKAKPLYLHALSIQEECFSPYHPDISDTLHAFAILYQKQDNRIEAQPLLQRAYMIRKRTFGSHHPDTSLLLMLIDEMKEALLFSEK